MTHFAKLDDALQIAYDIQGEGPALLLLHGLQGGRKMLAGLVPMLATSFCVINFDQRDSGETLNPPESYDLAQLADDAAALVRALGFTRVNVFGTSFGGRLGQVLAIRHPDVVDRLVLGATWAMPQSIAEINPQGTARFMRIRSELPASAGELAEMFVPKAFLDTHPDVREQLLAMPDAPERAARRVQAAATVHGEASSIAAPTLVIAGEVDELIPAAVTLDMARLIPGARAVTLEGVGHVASLQAPAKLAELVRGFIL